MAATRGARHGCDHAAWSCPAGLHVTQQPGRPPLDLLPPQPGPAQRQVTASAVRFARPTPWQSSFHSRASPRLPSCCRDCNATWTAFCQPNKCLPARQVSTSPTNTCGSTHVCQPNNCLAGSPEGTAGPAATPASGILEQSGWTCICQTPPTSPSKHPGCFGGQLRGGRGGRRGRGERAVVGPRTAAHGRAHGRCCLPEKTHAPLMPPPLTVVVLPGAAQLIHGEPRCCYVPRAQAALPAARSSRRWAIPVGQVERIDAEGVPAHEHQAEGGAWPVWQSACSICRHGEPCVRQRQQQGRLPLGTGRNRRSRLDPYG